MRVLVCLIVGFYCLTASANEGIGASMGEPNSKIVVNDNSVSADYAKHWKNAAKAITPEQVYYAENQRISCANAGTNLKRYLPKFIKRLQTSPSKLGKQYQAGIDKLKNMHRQVNNYNKEQWVAKCAKDWSQGQRLIQCAANASNDLNMLACMAANGG